MKFSVIRGWFTGRRRQGQESWPLVTPEEWVDEALGRMNVDGGVACDLDAFEHSTDEQLTVRFALDLALRARARVQALAADVEVWVSASLGTSPSACDEVTDLSALLDVPGLDDEPPSLHLQAGPWVDPRMDTLVTRPLTRRERDALAAALPATIGFDGVYSWLAPYGDEDDATHWFLVMLDR